MNLRKLYADTKKKDLRETGNTGLSSVSISLFPGEKSKQEDISFIINLYHDSVCKKIPFGYQSIITIKDIKGAVGDQEKYPNFLNN
ncbi:MAG: hypothetical protein OQK82_02370 [Candidatus Pacearchaeota archaeon]|nr:hypothetical protein [Candidatus Pacearchaeota archaeon]